MRKFAPRRKKATPRDKVEELSSAELKLQIKIKNGRIYVLIRNKYERQPHWERAALNQISL